MFVSDNLLKPSPLLGLSILGLFSSLEKAERVDGLCGDVSFALVLPNVKGTPHRDVSFSIVVHVVDVERKISLWLRGMAAIRFLCHIVQSPCALIDVGGCGGCRWFLKYQTLTRAPRFPRGFHERWDVKKVAWLEGHGEIVETEPPVTDTCSATP